MEAWLNELNEALARGLASEDDGDDFEELFFQMLALVSEEIASEPLGGPHICGSKPCRDFLFRES